MTSRHADASRTASSILGDYVGGIKLLEAGMKMVEETGRMKAELTHLRHAMAEVYRNWAESLANPGRSEGRVAIPGEAGRAQSGASPIAQRVDLLEQGLRYEPSNREIVAMLAKIVMSKSRSTRSNSTRRGAPSSARELRQGPPEVYNDLAEVRLRPEAARRGSRVLGTGLQGRSPGMHPTGSSLDTHSSSITSPGSSRQPLPFQLDRALELANQALAMKPGDPGVPGDPGRGARETGPREGSDSRPEGGHRGQARFTGDPEARSPSSKPSLARSGNTPPSLRPRPTPHRRPESDASGKPCLIMHRAFWSGLRSATSAKV